MNKIGVAPTPVYGVSQKKRASNESIIGAMHEQKRGYIDCDLSSELEQKKIKKFYRTEYVHVFSIVFCKLFYNLPWFYIIFQLNSNKEFWLYMLKNL